MEAKNKVLEDTGLVGMHAYLIKKGKIERRAYIMGRASNNYYIVQAINELTGEPNVARLMSVKELSRWYIMPDENIANYTFEDYNKDDTWRYNFPTDNEGDGSTYKINL